ncbi:predicted protein [Uncinocarpus reesii 1704]|uniref:DUF7514 domain-containing protein n=1 Tax=Uncinocarpus reesii (strain UAMH 1704) TaxID=336963 RepID=C4JJ79_UNCRE|nr:uncharacterized protein UREG_01686 [Uncinocarpus reesii 1704]EEP76837.1 predicted protein [Uncinocarpus reesii 1704]
MASKDIPAEMQWNYLINPDKSPTVQFEQLCLGIANFISNLAKSHTRDLTPDKLAAFYKKVGGDYDSIFLSTPPASLSFIYQKLGCFHSLQPTCDAFEPPSVPALLPHGFVRWQTIQLLLCPEEHGSHLQEAIKKFDIINPATGEAFPKEISRSVFPTEPDPEIVQWHDSLSKKLEHDFWASKTGIFPGRSDSPDKQSHRHPNAKDTLGHNARHDYFSQRRSGRDVPVRMTPNDSPPPFPHSRDHAAHDEPSPLAGSPEPRQQYFEKEPRNTVKESRSSQSFRRGRLSPPREDKRGRSCTPSRLRWSQRATDSSDSSDSSDSEDLPSPIPRMPCQHHLHYTEVPSQRRHSHDVGASSQRRWSKSPNKPRGQNSKEDLQSHHSPATQHARQYYYAYDPTIDESDTEHGSFRPMPSTTKPPSARRSSHQDHHERYPMDPPPEFEYLSRTTSAPVRKPLYPNPNPTSSTMRPKPKEYHVIHPDYTRSEPTSPGPRPSGSARHNSHSRTPPGGMYTRYYVPRAEPEPYLQAVPPPQPSRSRRSSRTRTPARSRSRGNAERPFTQPGGMKYQSMPGPGKRYRTEWE